jgi:capsule polysaccharide export protein KpsC/LpsZ
MINKIIVEKPISWMKNKFLGIYTTDMYNNVLNALKEFIQNKDIKIINTFFHTAKDDPLKFYRRTPCFNSEDTLYLSYHTYGEAKENLWRIKENYLPGYFSVDKMGYSGFSDFANKQNTINHMADDQTINSFLKNLSNNTFSQNLSKYPQVLINNTFNLKDYIFFPLQIEKDTVMSLSRFDYYELISIIANNITNYKIVIKPHPRDNNKKLMPLLSSLKNSHNNIFISNLSVHQLIPNALCCMTINSGVGFEALLYGKPCITFGKSDYDNCTTRCISKEQINNKLIEVAVLEHNMQHINQFIYHYLNKYCIYSTDTTGIKQKILNLLNPT